MRPPDLLKRCGCPDLSWAKCAHGWHLLKMIDGHRQRVSFDTRFRIKLIDGKRQVVPFDPRASDPGSLIRSVADAVAARDAFLTTWRTGGPTATAAAPAPTAAGVTLGELATRYAAAQADNPDRSATYLGNLDACLALITSAPIADARPHGPQTLGALPVTAVTDDQLEAMLHGLTRAEYAVSYRNKVLGTTRRLGRWAARKGYGVTPWLDAATSDVKRKKEIRRDRRLLEAIGPDGATEEDALLAAASLYMQALIIAGIDTAARIGELLALQWRDVSPTRNTLTIRVDLKNVEKPPRTIPLTARLAAVLAFRRIGPDDQPHDPDGYVFGNEVGERIGSVLTAWENTVLKAHGHPVLRRANHGLTAESRAAYGAIDLVFHDLRHEAISRWAEAGVAPNLLLEWTGITNLETLSIYINKARQKVAAAAMLEAEAQNTASPWASLPARAAAPVAARPRPGKGVQ
jgi:integrase